MGYSHNDLRSHVPMMLISAALFGYFGFATGWGHRYSLDTPPQLLIMVSLLMWTLRIGAMGFLLAAVLAWLGQRAAVALYGVLGVATAIVFLAVAVGDWRSPQYMSGVPIILLLIFAVWNGYSSATLLRDWWHELTRQRSD